MRKKIFNRYVAVTVAVIVLILLLTYTKPTAARATAEAGKRISRFVKESLHNIASSTIAPKKKAERKHGKSDFQPDELETYKYRRIALGVSLKGGGAAPVPIEDRIIKLGPDYGEEEFMPGLAQGSDIAPVKAETKLPPGVFPIMSPSNNQTPTNSQSPTVPQQPTTTPQLPGNPQPPTGSQQPINIANNYGYPIVSGNTGTVLQPTTNTNSSPTPIPASILLLASGLTGIAGMRLMRVS